MLKGNPEEAYRSHRLDEPERLGKAQRSLGALMAALEELPFAIPLAFAVA